MQDVAVDIHEATAAVPTDPGGNGADAPHAAAAAAAAATVTTDDDKEDDTNGNDDNEEDTDTTDDDVLADDEADDDKGVSPEEAERLLLEAVKYKEEGNGHFAKTEKRDEAVRCYRRGLNRLKKLTRGPSESLDERVITLYVTLSTNLATVLFQQGKYGASVTAATRALERRPGHVKARYRRAVAARRLGDSETAVSDLRRALQTEPSHAACRRELHSVQRAVRVATRRQKQALSKAFAADGGVSLYEDKTISTPSVEEPPTPEELAAAREAERRRWEDDCVQRMARGDDAVAFEDWRREREETRQREERKAEEKEEERQRREKEERQRRRRAEKEAAAAANKQDESDGDEEELTEAELRALRGYKKTKDGRITSYFTRELSAEEQARLAAHDTGPKKLSVIAPTTGGGGDTDPNNAPTTRSVADDDGTHKTTTTTNRGPSAWNRAGTWEEKDCTAWCHGRLRERLCDVRTDACRVLTVDSLTGDASVVWTQGRRRHVFDLHATLQYSWTAAAPGDAGESNGNDDDDDDDKAEKKKKKTAKGIVRLPDISSTISTQEDLEVIFDGWKRAPASPAETSRAVADRPALERALQQAVQMWLQDFHDHYRPH